MTNSAAPRRGRPPGSQGAELLGIAREAFLTKGFRGATMDGIAAAAGISKQSLYAAYPSKAALYDAVVRDWVDRGVDAMRPHLQALTTSTGAADALLTFAKAIQRGLLSRPVLQMRTLVAAEATRMPQTAADYVERSWDHNLALLADAFEGMTARGLLAIPDPSVAAAQFTWLVIAEPLNRLTLLGPDATAPEAELDVTAQEAVRTFMDRFATAAAARD